MGNSRALVAKFIEAFVITANVSPSIGGTTEVDSPSYKNGEIFAGGDAGGVRGGNRFRETVGMEFEFGDKFFEFAGGQYPILLAQGGFAPIQNGEEVVRIVAATRRFGKSRQQVSNDVMAADHWRSFSSQSPLPVNGAKLQALVAERIPVPDLADGAVVELQSAIPIFLP